MPAYILKRLAMSIATMFFIIVLTFVLMHSVPGGPFSPEKAVPPEVIAALNQKYGLDKPLIVQFGNYLSGLLHFNLGPSFKYPGRTVNDFIVNGAPYSMRLGFVTIAFAVVASIPMGVVAAKRNGHWPDAVVMVVATLGVTIPSFVAAAGLIYLFSYRLKWVPTFGLNAPITFILPVLALGGYSLSFLARLVRSSMLEVMGQDYIRTARAKGVGEWRIVFRHALRNAMIPFLTVLGPTIAGLMTGSFVIEKIFAIPGMGGYFVNSVTQRDYTTIMGMTVFYAAFLIVMVFIIDMFFRLIDPRIQLD
ncbi:MAG: ABC transporter permease [Propionibacteriaceae bacterium]|nr:ABC transporter permease [Propionibacteriaceae bacterium]